MDNGQWTIKKTNYRVKIGDSSVAFIILSVSERQSYNVNFQFLILNYQLSILN